MASAKQEEDDYGDEGEEGDENDDYYDEEDYGEEDTDRVPDSLNKNDTS